MSHISQFLNAIQYNIVSINKFNWNCYGTDIVCLDSNKDDTYDASVNFCTKTEQIREVTLYDYNLNNTYRWTDPEYVFPRQLEAMKNNVDDRTAYGTVKFTDLETIEDILEKIEDIYNGLEYDEKVTIALDISNRDFLEFAKAAHYLDITFNEFVEKSIKEAVEKEL